MKARKQTELCVILERFLFLNIFNIFSYLFNMHRFFKATLHNTHTQIHRQTDRQTEDKKC